MFTTATTQELLDAIAKPSEASSFVMTKTIRLITKELARRIDGANRAAESTTPKQRTGATGPWRSGAETPQTEGFYLVAGADNPAAPALLYYAPSEGWFHGGRGCLTPAFWSGPIIYP